MIQALYLIFLVVGIALGVLLVIVYALLMIYMITDILERLRK